MYTIHVRAQSRTDTHSRVPEDKIQWTDKSIKQLSMQCHVRTVCSTISTQSHWEGSIVRLWLFLVVRQSNRNRLQTRTKKTAAGLLVDCSQEQWERSEVTGWCYDTDAVKMLVCRSRQHSICGKTLYGGILIKVLNSAMVCFQHGTSDCVICALELKSKAVTQVCSPNQHVTYLQTAVWILHKLLSKYQKLRITIQGITMLNIILKSCL